MSSTPTPSPSKIFGRLRSSRSSSEFAPPPLPTTSVNAVKSPPPTSDLSLSDLDIATAAAAVATPATGDEDAARTVVVAMRQARPLRVNAKMGAFEMSIALLNEAASLAAGVPYLGAVANIFMQIIRIKSVRFPLPYQKRERERDGLSWGIFF